MTEATARRSRLNRDERAFQAAAIEIMETPASPSARWLIAFIVASAAGALIWSWYGRLDTHAELRGRIIPAGKVQVAEPLMAGTIRAIHVQPGDKVAAGDLLVELDPEEHVAERTKLAGGLAAAETSAARLKATLAAVARGAQEDGANFLPPPDASAGMVLAQRQQMRQSLGAFWAEQARLDAQILERRAERARVAATLEERRGLLALSTERLEIFETLEKRGVGVRTDTIGARQSERGEKLAAASEAGQLKEIDAAIASLEAQKGERRAAYLDRLATEFSEADRTIDAVKQDLAKAELLERASRITAPIAGRVEQIAVNTRGEVVGAGEQLMVIVPEAMPLEVEAILLNKDKGFVREGQPVRVKLDAFPFTRYGTLQGIVLKVSNNAVPAAATPRGGDAEAQEAAGPLVFPVRIGLAGQEIVAEGVPVELASGMSVTAEVKTGERRVIEFLLDPLLEMKDEAFHER